MLDVIVIFIQVEIMKKLLLLSAITVFTFSSSTALATNSLNGCEIKKQKLTEQIEYAKKHDNKYQIAGLETALSKVETYCTPESLYQESQQKVSEKEQKVKEREAELVETKAKGDIEKIAKRERKLAEAQAELHEAQTELTANKKFVK